MSNAEINIYGYVNVASVKIAVRDRALTFTGKNVVRFDREAAENIVNRFELNKFKNNRAIFTSENKPRLIGRGSNESRFK